MLDGRNHRSDLRCIAQMCKFVIFESIAIAHYHVGRSLGCNKVSKEQNRQADAEQMVQNPYA